MPESEKTSNPATRKEAIREAVKEWVEGFKVPPTPDELARARQRVAESRKLRSPAADHDVRIVFPKAKPKN